MLYLKTEFFNKEGGMLLTKFLMVESLLFYRSWSRSRLKTDRLPNTTHDFMPSIFSTQAIFQPILTTKIRCTCDLGIITFLRSSAVSRLFLVGTGIENFRRRMKKGLKSSVAEPLTVRLWISFSQVEIPVATKFCCSLFYGLLQQGRRSQGFRMEPELYFLLGSGSYSYSYSTLNYVFFRGT